MSKPLWSGNELAAVFHQPGFNANVYGVSIDTRTLKKGDLFVALKDVRDGHDFVPAAVSAGAAAVLVDHPVSVDCPQLVVDDTLEGLRHLARAARRRITGQVMAVTGSSGKTTFRAWAEQVLAVYGRTHASVGSYNNHWGVPLSLARMPADAEFAIFEVGTSHPGEISPLSTLVKPDVAILLNVLPAHIGNFENMQALQREKLSIADGLSEAGCFVLKQALMDLTALNAELPYRLLTFGAEADADISLAAASDGQLQIRCEGNSLELQVPFNSPERIDSVLALVGVLAGLGLDVARSSKAFNGLELPAGRGNQLDVAGVTLIDDSYNANPVSMKMALRSLRDLSSSGRKIALLGEILEQGDASEAAHRDVLTETPGIDEVLTFGAGFAGLPAPGNCRHLDDVSSLDLESFAGGLSPGDVVLVKGSNKVFWTQNFVGRLHLALAGRE